MNILESCGGPQGSDLAKCRRSMGTYAKWLDRYSCLAVLPLRQHDKSFNRAGNGTGIGESTKNLTVRWLQVIIYLNEDGLDSIGES